MRPRLIRLYELVQIRVTRWINLRQLPEALVVDEADLMAVRVG